MRTGAFAPSDASRFDECDIVIRFNDCQSAGEGGLKTDVVAVCNTGRPRLRNDQTALLAREGGTWSSPSFSSASSPVSQLENRTTALTVFPTTNCHSHLLPSSPDYRR